jgi:hypothetical protein
MTNVALTWTVHQTIEICEDGEEKLKLPQGIDVVSRDKNWHEVKSVSEAVAELNTGKISADKGLCIVRSEEKKKFILLFRSDKEQEAYEKSQRKPPPVTLIKWKTLEVVAKLPLPVREKLEQLSDVIGYPVWKTTLGVPCSTLLLLISPQNVTMDIVGGGYPLVQTVKLIANPGTDLNRTGNAMEFWQTYWVVFALLKSSPLDFFLRNLPTIGRWSHHLKLAFFVWLYSPRTKGAQILLDQFKKLLIPKLQDQGFLKKAS